MVGSNVRRRTAATKWRVGVVVTLGAVLAACTSADEPLEQMEALGLIAAGEDPMALFEYGQREASRTQELIAECMALEGFEYIEYIPSPSADVAEGLTAAEYKERYGWGMLASSEHSLLRFQPGGQEEDPNLVLRREMDEPTRIAWETAMYGPPDARGDDDRREGCQEEAEFLASAHEQTEAWNELAPLLYEIPERVVADPRSVEARRNWSRCMAEAGYRVDDVLDVFALIDERVWDVWLEQTPPPGEPEHPGLNRMHPWFVETDAWQELVQFELDISAADDACSQDVDLFDGYYERFIEDNEALIQQLQTELVELQP